MEHLQTQGIALPKLGLGTWRLSGKSGRAAVESALALGYRHIDTAEMYGNEEAVGAAIAGAGIARKELHVTTNVGTRIWHRSAPPGVRYLLEEAPADLVDLYLVHWPAP